tara:strand:- start:247 stop:396 length:150 start_codon:yes stop_codon:yes gene_type:complete
MNNEKIYLKMAKWAKEELTTKIHTAEEKLLIDSVLEFAIDGLDMVRTKQ